jgi:ABC-type multidrug transport system ATPase subunit
MNSAGRNQILEADSMWLEYDGRKILQSIYLKVETGKVTGLLGRNGTGKTSLLRMIFGTLRGQSQSVRVDGRYISHPYLEKDLIRYLPQHNFVPHQLRIKRICSLYQVSFDELATHFPELKELGNQRLGSLSGGNIRLFETLLILFSPVQFVLLDEPFTHLSPIGIERISTIIADQKRRKGIILSDHIYKQVLDLSDEVYAIVPVGRSMLLKNPIEDLRLLGYTS